MMARRLYKGVRGGVRRALRLVGIEGLVRRKLEAPSSAAEGPDAPSPIVRDLRRIAKSHAPVIVGPWISEVGFEVLYWIPFLRWWKERHQVPAERLIAVSRGGAAQWYEGICGSYFDVFDCFTPDEFRERNLQRIEQAGVQKHLAMSDFDQAILGSVRDKLGVRETELLHPMNMYQLFLPFWRGRTPLRHVWDQMKFARFRGWDDDGPLSHLPAEYVAAKFYFSASFPDSPETRTAVKGLLEGLASRHHVVLLNTGLRIDDHAEYEGLPGDRIHTIDDLCVPSRNLELQCRVISRARSFVGTYGGFSYIAPLYGVPALALYSGTDSFLQAHLDIARRAFGGSSFGSFTAVDLRDLESLRQVLPLAPPATQAPSPLVEPSRRSRV